VKHPANGEGGQVTLKRLTEEFVKHFRNLREKMAGGLPAGLRKPSLVEDPQLRASIRELYLDWKVLEELDARSRRRDWPDAHPDFSKVYRERASWQEEHQIFGKRWKAEFLALLRQEYDRIFSDESFFRWFLRLSERCHEFEALRVQHPYESAVLRIERVTRDVQRPELADLFCEDPELFDRLPGLGGFAVNPDVRREAEEEAERRADNAARRKAEQAAKPEYEKAITRLRESMWDPDQESGDHDDWFFDPARHSAAELIGALANHCHDRGGDLPLWQRCAGAFDWLRDTVGLDLAEIERRWQRIDPIPVPQHVSQGHGPDDPESLFGKLHQVRHAYIIGADLAAIAMCRAVTEILFRRHYNDDQHTKLSDLIKGTPAFRKLPPSDQRVIENGVAEADRILHSGREDTRNKEPTEELIGRWIKALVEFIRGAPPGTRR
jgi:hypothetical protein